MPQDVTQHYDIFLHVYVSNPLGERRVGYKRYQTKQLLEEKWEKGPQWVLLEADPVVKDEMPIASAMIQVAGRGDLSHIFIRLVLRVISS